MNKYLVIVTLAFVCFVLVVKTDVVPKSDEVDYSGLASELALVPSDEQETAGLKDNQREQFSKFCTSYRDYIVEEMKCEYKYGGKNLSKRLLKRVFVKNQNVFKQIKAGINIGSVPEIICGRVPQLVRTLLFRLESANKALKSSDKIELKDIGCLTSISVLRIASRCNVHLVDRDLEVNPLFGVDMEKLSAPQVFSFVEHEKTLEI